MAEAVVQAPSNQSYFCHTCNVRIALVQEDFTCPTCGGGFVEEISETQRQPEGTGNPFEPLASLFGLGGQGTGGRRNPLFPLDMLLGSAAEGSRSHQNSRRGGRGGMNVEVRQTPSGSFSMTFGGNPASDGGQGQGGTGTGPNSDNPMEQMLFSFLNDLIVGLGGGGQNQGANMFGNLGDYVWGRDGLDAIVTQLMNQMEGSGPPPLPTDKIDQLPSVHVTQEQVDKKLQCSVCWDDFKLGEEVKQLDCDHLYHPPCILPWLKLHGTCPICRRDFTNNGASSNLDEEDGSRVRSGSQSATPHQPFSFNIPQVPQISNSSNTSTPNENNPQADGQGQVGTSTINTGRGGNPTSRFNMDLEFD